MKQASFRGHSRSYVRCVRLKPERRKIALLAVAHGLVKIMHAMLKSGKVYRPRK